MILGVLFLFGFGSLCAIVFALIARRQIRTTDQGGRGLATAGLTLGCVGLVGIAAIFGIAYVAGPDRNAVTQNHAVKFDLANMASAEDEYHADTHHFTHDPNNLIKYGSGPVPHTETIVIGDHGSGFCLIGNYGDGNHSWFLWDRERYPLPTSIYRQYGSASSNYQRFGFAPTAYHSEFAAEKSCTVPGITDFFGIGTGN